eukprot:Gb_21316 [translate_table: standard]
MRQPSWRQSRQLLLFPRVTVQHQATKATLCTVTKNKTRTKTSATLQEGFGFGNSNGENSSRHISGDLTNLCKQGRLKEALNILQTMDQRGVRADSNIYVSLLTACINKKALAEGKLVHTHIRDTGFQPDISVSTKLVSMYAKCGNLVDARRVLDQMPKRNVVSWTAMIAAYAKHGRGDEALKLYHEMQRTGNQPDQYTFASVLPACSNLATLKEVHEDIVRAKVQSNVFVGSGLVDMYAKCGMIEDARQPNSVTFAGVLPACANLAALEHGKEVHEDIIRSGYQSDVFVGSALIDMYTKCGNIENARKLFDTMHEKNVVLWNSMIIGYGMHGFGKEALQLFERMQPSGTKPDHVTFVGVLSACCHAGLVDDGWQYFNSMSRDYHIAPGGEHYCCMVDLLGRAGSLDEAHEFINKMPIKPDAAVWGSLLGSCRIHNNIELGERVAECLFELDSTNSAHYVLMSNIYAAAGRWDDMEKVRKLMKGRRLKKTPGRSWIEVNKKVYAFLVGDRSHPQTPEIYAKLERLSGQMKEEGYVPATNFVLHDVEEEQKEHFLGHHSEKLAIAFGIINTSPGTPIRVVKNLRVCGDCHSAIKFVSKIDEREIVEVDDHIGMDYGLSEYSSWPGDSGSFAFPSNGTRNVVAMLWLSFKISFVGPVWVLVLMPPQCCYPFAICKISNKRAFKQTTSPLPVFSEGFLKYVKEVPEDIIDVNFSLMTFSFRCLTRDLVIWTLRGAGYAQNGYAQNRHADESLKLFQQMQQTDIYEAVGSWQEKGKLRKIMKDGRVKMMSGQSGVAINNKVAGEAGYMPYTKFVWHYEKQQEEHSNHQEDCLHGLYCHNLICQLWLTICL